MLGARAELINYIPHFEDRSGHNQLLAFQAMETNVDVRQKCQSLTEYSIGDFP